MASAKSWIVLLGVSALLTLSGCRTKDQADADASPVAASNDQGPADPTAQSKSAKPLKPKGPGATHSWDDGAGGEWR